MEISRRSVATGLAWAVPAVAEGEEADPAAAQTCTAQAQRLSEEKEDQLNGAVLTSSELGNYGTDEKHCVEIGRASCRERV